MAGAAPRFEKRRYVPPGVRAGRLALISVAIGFLALLLLAPLGAVLGQAFAEGWSVFLESFDNPDTLAAIKLTLLTAAIVVPFRRCSASRPPGRSPNSSSRARAC